MAVKSVFQRQPLTRPGFVSRLCHLLAGKSCIFPDLNFCIWQLVIIRSTFSAYLLGRKVKVLTNLQSLYRNPRDPLYSSVASWVWNSLLGHIAHFSSNVAVWPTKSSFPVFGSYSLERDFLVPCCFPIISPKCFCSFRSDSRPPAPSWKLSQLQPTVMALLPICYLCQSLWAFPLHLYIHKLWSLEFGVHHLPFISLFTVQFI